MKPLSVRALALVTACLGSLNLADAAQQPKASISPRLCIYNEPPYHYEVVLGLVHTFAPEYGANMLVSATHAAERVPPARALALRPLP